MKRNLIAGLLCLVAAGTANAGGPPSVAAWKGWVKGLAGSGYAVTQGGVTIIDNAACSEIVAVFGSCFGNNPAAPYIIPQPPIDATYVDPHYATAFTAAGATGAPSNMFYRLANTDALVTIVGLPPKAAYMGYQSYLFTSAISNYPTATNGQVASPDPSRYEIFGSLGNDINNVVVDKGLQVSWGAGAVVYITTSNKRLGDALVANARARGFDCKRIFVEPVGANVLTGITASSADLVTLIRYALPKDKTAGTRWTNNAATNVLSFRVAAAPTAAVSRFRTPLYTRKIAVSESSYQTALNELSELLRRWTIAHDGRPAVAEPMITSEHVNAAREPYGLVGSDCIAKGTNCLGDNQDTDAYRFGVVGKLTGRHMVFIAGVNHAVVDNARYISLAVYNMQDFAGVASISQTNPKAVGFDSGTLTGSAEGVLKALGLYAAASPQLKAVLPKLYTAILSRHCTLAPAYCVALSDRTLLPLSSGVSVTQRAYIKPGTTTGGNPDKMLTPVLIFRPEA